MKTDLFVANFHHYLCLIRVISYLLGKTGKICTFKFAIYLLCGMKI